MTVNADLAQIGYETIGAAIEVHRHLGPGLLEHIYEDCLSSELEMRGIPYDRQVSVPVRYKGRDLGSRYRIDLLVANQLIIEIKSVEIILDVHKAQLLSQLRLTGIGSGLLINFNVARLHEGVRRAVNSPGLTLTESFSRSAT
ncbi:MAG: GxxExxY protein [Gemmatimonadota bacterium]